MSLSVMMAVVPVRAQVAVDTIAIATTVGRAIGKASRRRGGPFIVDTAATGFRFTVAAIKASRLKAEFLNGANAPICQFYPTKADPESPYLFRLEIDSVTTRQAIVWSEVACHREGRPDYWARERFVVRYRSGHWVVTGPRRVQVT
jgi:hypothetical protein